MKKTISLFLALVLCLSLCACGSGEIAENPYEKYTKYEELFLYLESNDYDNANAYIQKFFGVSEEGNKTEPSEPENTETEPVETEPTYKTIEITIDNWQDYFELELVVYKSKNAFGELDYFFPQMRFHLKEDWASIATDMEVVFEYNCTDAYACQFTYNMDTGELIEGEKTDDYVTNPLGTISEMDERSIKDGTWLFGNSKRNIVIEGNMASITADMYSTVEILRIQGTITIAE
jgi:hypothetical protein